MINLKQKGPRNKGCNTFSEACLKWIYFLINVNCHCCVPSVIRPL